ncbi:tubulin epsilon and delta complex protein 1 isoform X2 [Archocentrus centrarchus]|uniref:tubulin epsilon and delta complex protein 1 isoform X2 n=1 Tax=Archocentrus centrarchus TaxID=63155 RepID=UPI0011E9F37F|nr:tubulin epsilon and delta complex protein 1 isoform X2 [Archocentrus centrarchus]
MKWPARDDQFWQLLADILQTTGIVSPDSAEPRAECRKLVAVGLWQSGYHADWMYEDKEGGHFSSRDLLLALGWLLAAGALENVVMKRVQKLDRTLLTCTPVKPHFSADLWIDSASLRRLQWLIGCLRHERRMLLSMLQEQTRALHAVLSASVASAAPASSDQISAALKEECVCVRQLCDLLEAYLKWKQVEEVFWTWMDSVVDFHLKDPVTRRPKHPPNESPGVCCHGNSGLEKLEEMLLRLSTAQREQRRGGEAGKDREGDERLQGGCGASSSLPPLLSSLPSLPSLPQVCRASLRPEEPRRFPAGGPCSRAEAPNELSASEAVELLRHTEAVLMKRRDRQRLANRMKLQETIGRLDELVLIPP